MKSKLFTAMAALCSVAFGQTGPTVSQTEGSPNEGVTAILTYDGSSNLIYRCRTAANRPRYIPFRRSDSSLTNIVVATNVGTATTSVNHGLQIGSTITVAGSATTGLNVTSVVATTPSATTFTFAVTVANGTYTDSTLTISTTAPRSSAAIWAIEKFTYSGTNLVLKQWANGGPGYANICDNQTTLAYQ